MENGRTRTGLALRGKSHLGWWVGATVLLIIAMVYAISRYEPTSAVKVTPDRPPANAGTQVQPQGQTGPIETTTGGAPPTSPEGETPPGMQVKPPQ
jgi:hypothetical protein